MRLLMTPLAEQDLETIADYIAVDNSVRAMTFIVEMREQCRRIAQNPAGYRLRSELGEDVRSCVYGRYVIFFQASPLTVSILRVLHGARDLPATLAADQDNS